MLRLFDQRDATRCLLAAGCLLLPLLAGCGGDGLNPVKGQLIWSDDNSPAKELEGASVNFELPGKNTSSIGTVQPDGSFTLMTASPNDGAYAGEYTVLISERRASAGGEKMAPTKAAERYNDRKTSDLKAEVKPGKNELTLKVDRNK
jgi:hypothetical protein